MAPYVEKHPIAAAWAGISLFAIASVFVGYVFYGICSAIAALCLVSFAFLALVGAALAFGLLFLWPALFMAFGFAALLGLVMGSGSLCYDGYKWGRYQLPQYYSTAKTAWTARQEKKPQAAKAGVLLGILIYIYSSSGSCVAISDS